MFRPNETHHQQDFFGTETQLSPELRQRLRDSKEYAFYEEVFCRIPEEVFADLYSGSPATRPNTPVNVLVGALILQHMYGWTFAELMDRVDFDVKVRAALGLPGLGQRSFSRATLFNFLARLHDDMVATGRNRFETAFDGLTDEQRKRFGLNSSIQRCDSTQMGSNIRDYTRIELLVEVVLRMWRVLDQAHKEEHAERFAPYVDAKTSGQFLYRLSRSDIDQTLVQLGQLYGWMVESLKAGYGSAEIHRIVCRVFAEQFTRVEEKIAVRAAEEIRSDSLQSPDDPEATYREKDGEHFHGFVLHATETADPQNDLQLIVDVAVAPNNQDDSRILHDRLPGMHEKTPDLCELHSDAAYPSEANDRLQNEFGILAVQTAIRGRTAGAPMRIDLDESGHLQVRCAAGHVVTGRCASKHLKAEFAATHCAACPFAAVCTTQRRAHGGRTFYFTEADVVKQARHRRIETLPKERRTVRANVEATMKEFKAPCRNGKLRTRGRWGVSRYGFLRAMGINFGRIYRHLQRLQANSGTPAPTRRFSAGGHALLEPIRRLVWVLRGTHRNPITVSAALA